MAVRSRLKHSLLFFSWEGTALSPNTDQCSKLTEYLPGLFHEAVKGLDNNDLRLQLWVGPKMKVSSALPLTAKAKKSRPCVCSNMYVVC